MGKLILKIKESGTTEQKSEPIKKYMKKVTWLLKGSQEKTKEQITLSIS